MKPSPLAKPFKRRKTTRLVLLKKHAFDKLTKHQKRVAIARDLLLRLRLKRIKASPGSVMRLNRVNIVETSAYLSRVATSASDVQAILNAPQECPVCARGALLATWVGNFDSFDGDALHRVDHCSVSRGFPTDLVETFGPKLMAGLEMAFERPLDGDPQHIYAWDRLYVSVENYAALKQAFPQNDVDKRLKAIYSNVVRHRGKLVVKDATGQKLIFD